MGCVYSRVCIGEVCTPREAKIKESQNVRNTEIPIFSPDSSNEEDGEGRDQFNQLNQRL